MSFVRTEPLAMVFMFVLRISLTAVVVFVVQVKKAAFPCAFVSEPRALILALNPLFASA